MIFFNVDPEVVSAAILLQSASNHWPLDDLHSISNNAKPFWGWTQDLVEQVEGPLQGALKTKPSKTGVGMINLGQVDLSCWIEEQNTCQDGVSFALWLMYKTDPEEEKVFLHTGNLGIRIFQSENLTNSISVQVKTKDKKCVYVFDSPPKIWTHFILTRKTQVKIYLNGGQVTKFTENACVNENAPSSYSVSENLVLGAATVFYDDLRIWERALEDVEVLKVYSFYSGKCEKQASNYSITV